MTTADEAIEMIAELGMSREKIAKIIPTVQRMLEFAVEQEFTVAETLSIFGTCITDVIVSYAPSHDAALRAAARHTRALWQSLGIDIEFAQIAEAANVDASKLN